MFIQQSKTHISLDRHAHISIRTVDFYGRLWLNPFTLNMKSRSFFIYFIWSNVFLFVISQATSLEMEIEDITPTMEILRSNNKHSSMYHKTTIIIMPDRRFSKKIEHIQLKMIDFSSYFTETEDSLLGKNNQRFNSLLYLSN